MIKQLYFPGAILLAIFAAGCAVKAETYVMEKPRVGIEYKGGNAGYLKGAPSYVEPEKKTRKIYILELSKPIGETPSKKIQVESSTDIHETVDGDSTTPAEQVEDQARPLVISPVEDVSNAPAADSSARQGPTETILYTVEKDDTLQKIAKKFYGSYGKWTKIYEANKEKLKNPNFVRPGTVLTIPAGDS